jgi:iron complex outermembrane recepter protein
MINKTKIAVKSCLFLALLGSTTLVSAEEQNEVLNLSVEDLLNVEVTSVAKKAQSLNDAAAAIFVISNEDIKRTGVTNIPDALRLAPGLDIARISANQWAVSSRGFNGRFANKLLVLVDGRNAYARSFSGVYWEDQDVMLEDIDRIEVIRGPGAALWGANAVNGVINIITKNSAETQGGLLTGGGGNQERGFGSLRYGVKLGEETSARAYVKGFDRNQNTLQSGGEAGDDWSKVQGGFRLDSQLNTQDALTVQGDVYQATVNQFAYFPQVSAPYLSTGNTSNERVGGNLLGRFQHTFSPTADYSLQFFYDAYKHEETMFTDRRHTLDLQFQHRFGLLDWHEIIWGAAYNYGNDQITGNQAPNGSAPGMNFIPDRINDQLASAFIQDEMTLIDNKLWLTIGARFEHNDYSGFEGQPSAKVMWAPHNQHRLWAGVSRAVRTPSRAERYGSVVTRVIPPQAVSPFPCPPACTPAIQLVAQGNTSYKSEEVISYEAGYRTTFSKAVSLDITGFYNDYRDLRSVDRGTPSFNGTSVTQPLDFTNNLGGETYGVEIATIWQMLDWWRWDVNYSWLHTQLNDSDPKTGISPQQRVSLRGALSPWQAVDLDFWFRYVDTNLSQTAFGPTAINAYVTLDLRAAWRPVKDVELSVVGQNLLQQSHLEYVSENQTYPTLIDRGVYGKLSWNF